MNQNKYSFDNYLTRLHVLSDCKVPKQLVHLLADIKGTIVFIGVGKSGIVSQKLVATLNSLSTPAQYLYASEMMHGDLGRLTSDDAVCIISRSGNSDELVKIAAILSERSIPMGVITNSSKGQIVPLATYAWILPEVEEMDNDGLVPTTSSTAQLIAGDLLCLCIAERRGIGAKHFKNAHPGGNLGRRLAMTVSDIMRKEASCFVDGDADLKAIISAISKGRVGACIVNENDTGIITDGDLRRIMSVKHYETKRARDIMTHSPKKVRSEAKIEEALQIMEEYKISQLLVIHDDKVVGIVHIHDCIEAGVL